MNEKRNRSISHAFGEAIKFAETGDFMPNAESDVFSLLVSKTVQSIRRQTRGAPVDSLQQMKHVPIIELVNEVIEEAVRCNASDVHVEPDGDIVRLRFRVDGMLCERHAPLPQEVHAFFVSRLKIMGGMDIAEHRLPQDGRILYVYDGVELDIRISTLPLLTGEKVVLRLLNDKRRLLQFSELDFSERNAAVFQRLCKMPSGLLLVTGQVNSGKTTTLYAALQLLDAARCNIVTLEDPVEYQLHGINQLQVNTKIHLDFAAGLRAVLRQDIRRA